MFDTNIQYVIVTLHTRCTSVNVTRTVPIQVRHQYVRYVQRESRTNRSVCTLTIAHSGVLLLLTCYIYVTCIQYVVSTLADSYISN